MDEKPSQVSSTSDIDTFIHRARETKKEVPKVLTHQSLEPGERARRTALTGALLGTLASLVFGLTTQAVNILLLPGVPLYRSVFDPLLNILVITAIGFIFSLVSVASLKIQNRLFALLLAAFGLFLVYYFYRTFGSIIAGMINGLTFSIIFLIPIFFAFVSIIPFGALVRWAVNAQVNFFYRPVRHWRRTLPAVVLLVVAVLCGTLFIYSAPEQKAIRTLDAFVKQSLKVQTKEELPGPIRNMWGTQFYPYAKGRYSLLAQHNPIPKRVDFDGDTYLMPIEFSVQFQTGYWFTCKFDRTGRLEHCFSFYTPPADRPISQVLR